ncbi:MAG: PqqD family protein [Desulfobacteraceae bacterium]|nr:PqqD family protein [Desulfobacteraceae bacterium]
MTIAEALSEKIWYPSGHVVTRKIVDETILVPISGNLANMQRIFTINEVGASIWAMINGKKTVKEIRNALSLEFDAEEDQLDKDLCDFIEQLKQSELILEQTV